MAVWPFARRTTYVNGSLPAIDGDDLVAMQDAIVELFELQVEGTLFRDDFFGAALSATLWTSTVTGGGASLSVGADLSAGAAGAVKLITTNTGSSQVVQIDGSAIPIGTRDFYFFMRARKVSGNANHFLFGGLQSGTAGNVIGFSHSALHPNLQFEIGGVVIADTGVDWTDLAYHDFIVMRLSGVITVIVDGSTIYSAAFTTALTDAAPQVANPSTGGDAAQFNVDKFFVVVP